MKTIVIDDTKLNREIILNFVRNYTPQLNIVGQANSVESAKQQIKMSNPELVFLDIELGDGSAFDLLESIGDIDFHIIFVTAYNHYALEAFKVNAVDYLLKPISIDDFKKAVDKVLSKASPHDHSFNQLKKEVLIESEIISISTSSGFESVQSKSIVRCQADGKYTIIWMENNKKIISSKNLKEFEQTLSKNNFFRVHHSHLVNLNYVQSFKRSDSLVILENGDEVPISQRKRKKFIQAMNLI